MKGPGGKRHMLPDRKAVCSVYRSNGMNAMLTYQQKAAAERDVADEEQRRVQWESWESFGLEIVREESSELRIPRSSSRMWNWREKQLI